MPQAATAEHRGDGVDRRNAHHERSARERSEREAGMRAFEPPPDEEGAVEHVVAKHCHRRRLPLRILFTIYQSVNAACRRWMPATACMWAGDTRGLLTARLGKASDGKTATAGSWSNKRQNDARGRGLLECVRAVVASYSRAALLSADHICGGTYHKLCMPAQRWFCREGMPMRVD